MALATGGAAVALVLLNVRDAELLRQSAAGGLLPATQLERAASLDERTLVATGLGIGAGVAAATALTLWLAAPAPSAPRLAVGVSSTGASVALSGSWP